MDLRLNYEKWDGTFAVPARLVDEELRLAGALQLKVLLWLLKNGCENRTAADLAAALGVSAADIADALAYWQLKGYLKAAGETAPKELAAFELDLPISELSKPQPEISKEPAPAPRRTPRPDSAFVAKRVEESQELSFLMQEAQITLGKALSPGLSGALIAAYDDLGLPADVILMILQYAKMRGKTSTAYIESVARNWAEEEIFTLEQADAKLRRLDESEKAWSRVSNLLGIVRRNPSKAEEAFCDTWINEWKMSDALILEAYDRCVNATGKMNFKYIGKVLESFRQNGVKSPADLKAAPEKAGNESRKSFETSDLEKFFNQF